ncbi:MAG: DUF4307 domain-containing protein [Actinobacteria bacterium]|nr:DUF4307 domain-containing protein [Actinomycetota bacterium]
MFELDLSDRYGQRPVRWKPLAVVLLIVGTAWLTWSGLHHSRPEIRTTLISFEIPSERSLAMRYSIDRRTPSLEVTCTLVAYDIDKNIVGEIQDRTPGGRARVEKTTVIPTRSSAVSGAVSRCRTGSQ